MDLFLFVEYSQLDRLLMLKCQKKIVFQFFYIHQSAIAHLCILFLSIQMHMYIHFQQRKYLHLHKLVNI